MLTVALAALLGAIAWTFLEYVIHRFLGHDRRFIRRTAFGREHTAHHSRGDYFAPWYLKGLAASVALSLSAALAVWVAGTGPGLAFAGGLTGTYLAYEVLHRLLHVWEGVGPYARWARRHHFYHHFHDPKRNHGVTSPLWDHVFGTHGSVEVIEVPPKLAMRWLTDAGTGALRPHLEGRYRLTARRGSAAGHPPGPAAAGGR